MKGIIRTGWSARAVLKYTLLQIPGTLLAGLLLWWIRIEAGVGLWLLWTLLGVWVAKDVVLFFFLWPAYDNEQGDYYGLKGHRGTVVDSLAPQGTVRVRGQTWKARSESSTPVPAGAAVRVMARQGLTLMVQPDEGTGEDRDPSHSR